MSYAAVAQFPVRTKSPEAFRTISEVAVELDVPQHVLRFWESRFAQIKPVKRAGGRRYYRPEDVDLLRGIRTLLYSDGYTIKGVQKVLHDRGLRFVAEIGRESIQDAIAVNAPAYAPAKSRAPQTPPAIAPVDPSAAAAEPEAEDDAPAAESEAAAARTVLPFERPLAEEEREKLEILLAELVQLKARFRTARRTP
jgi:DNA-binding transcriptional MerR regulator